MLPLGRFRRYAARLSTPAVSPTCIRRLIMKASAGFLRLALFGVLVTGCDSGPLAPETTAKDSYDRPSFDAVAVSQPVGPVTIETVIDFSAPPFGGTFAVTQGSELLGCAGGTFVDTPASVDNPGSGVPVSRSIHKAFTCTSGGSGTFIVNFQPTPTPGPGVLNGHWNVLRGTGDFTNLRGEGDFSVIFTSPATGQETLTGTIHFDP
jgi:hypothetical protein